MESTFFNAGMISAATTIILCIVLLLGICLVVKRKYGKEAPLTVAFSIALSGNLMSGLIMLTGLLSPLREYLTIASPITAVHSAQFYIFVMTGCLMVAFSSVMISLMAGLVIKCLFKGTSTAIELRENNIPLAILQAVVMTGLAVVFLSCFSLILQSFIPVPDIPVIR